MIRYGEVSNEIPKMEGFKKTSKDGDMFVAAALRSARQVNCDAQFFPEMSSCEPKTSRFEMTRESKEMQRAKRVSKFGLRRKVSNVKSLATISHCNAVLKTASPACSEWKTPNMTFLAMQKTSE